MAGYEYSVQKLVEVDGVVSVATGLTLQLRNVETGVTISVPETAVAGLYKAENVPAGAYFLDNLSEGTTDAKMVLIGNRWLGEKPAHEVSGSTVRFQNPDGTWGPWMSVGSGVEFATDAEAIAGTSETTVMSPATMKQAIGSWNLNFKNKLINGGFDIWQRGESFTILTGGDYSADRWVISSSGTTKTTNIDKNEAMIGDKLVNSIVLNTDVITTTGHSIRLAQRIENPRNFSNQTLTLSFYAKSDVNISLNNIFWAIHPDGGTEQIFEILDTKEVVAGANMRRYSVTFTLNDFSSYSFTENGFLYIGIGAKDNFQYVNLELAEIQLERGEVATEFEERPLPLELMLAQRYFQIRKEKHFLYFARNVNSILGLSNLSVQMRNSPSVTIISNPTYLYIYHDGTVSDYISGYISITRFPTVDTIEIDLNMNNNIPASLAGFRAYSNPKLSLDAEL